MKYPRQITVTQAAAILISTIIGVGVLPLPLFAVRAAGSGAPLITLISCFVAFIGLWLIALLGMRFPNQTIIQYSETIIGKWPARLGSAFIICFFAILTSLTAREFGEVVVASVLRRTPLEITVIVMLLLACFSARNNIIEFAYLHYFYLPLLLGPGLLIVVLSLKNADMTNLQPIWGESPQTMLSGIFTVSALFQGSFIFTMVIPAMRQPTKAMKASFWGLLISGGLYILITLAAVSVFGSEETRKLLWPTLELAKTTSLPGNILERLDAAFLAVWVIAVFTTLFSSYYITIHSMSSLFHLRNHKMFSLFLLPIVFILAMLPQNVLQMYDIIEKVGRIGLWITIAYPGVLLVMALIRKKSGGCHEKQTADGTN
ncbi:GerAB/ArcD/ProY family transporter [Paenibacillus thalictri]|uniref:Spore gernimation protein n=1 Tax=Paenibacillus thalictri TaxID=2527873 RepID=A0A4Q9E088_9BACL|nr:endospore germination permease [Paenibacillus thalictri]TBL81840.1 spore gernimation protein [Paenibacillus thalictri]